jgi:acyl-CoA hydrolase
MTDLASAIRPGDGIVLGQACAEPQTILEMLVAQRTALAGCQVFLGASYSGIARPEHADFLRFASYGGIGQNRALVDAGKLQVLKVAYSKLAGLIRSGEILADVVCVQVSPPNSRGEYSLGLAADYLVPALEVCRTVVAEVNHQVPWTHTQRLLQRDEIDMLIESSRPPAMPRARPAGALEAAIARNAAAFIPDGATLEFGVGVLPDAVCAALAGHRGLRIHSGTMGDGVVPLFEKQVFKSAECAMLIGSAGLFEFARGNATLHLRSSEYTHATHVLSGIDKFVAINSAVEVDLAGQVNSEVANGSYVGAIGGAPDFIGAANHSPGGVSLLLLPSSRIVERLSGPVSMPAAEAGVVVSELGAADLRGCTTEERARRLQKIAKGLPS